MNEQNIKDFWPICGGQVRTHAEKCVRLFPHAINKLFKELNIEEEGGVLIDSLFEIIASVTPIKTNVIQHNETNETQSILNKYGSDKCQINHNYHLVYHDIFNKVKLKPNANVLEVGMGTSDPHVPSNMKSIYSRKDEWRPGASIRAMKEILPNANIFGADVDTSILFTEEKIRTSFVDQLEFDSFKVMHQNFGNPKYDLIIEDGLHAITSSIYTLVFGLENISEDGIIVLEDLPNPKGIWNMIGGKLQTMGYSAELFDARGLLFVVSRK